MNGLPGYFIAGAAKACTWPKQARRNKAGGVSVKFLGDYVYISTTEMFLQFNSRCKANNTRTQNSYI